MDVEREDWTKPCVPHEFDVHPSFLRPPGVSKRSSISFAQLSQWSEDLPQGALVVFLVNPSWNRELPTPQRPTVQCDQQGFSCWYAPIPEPSQLAVDVEGRLPVVVGFMFGEILKLVCGFINDHDHDHVHVRIVCKVISNGTDVNAVKNAFAGASFSAGESFRLPFALETIFFLVSVANSKKLDIVRDKVSALEASVAAAVAEARAAKESAAAAVAEARATAEAAVAEARATAETAVAEARAAAKESVAAAVAEAIRQQLGNRA